MFSLNNINNLEGNNKNLLELFYKNTKKYFEFSDNYKKCIYCQENISLESPRCINCWLNNKNYYLLIEKIIITEKKNYFKNLFSELLKIKNRIINKDYQIYCECNLICKEIIKNNNIYLVCPKKNCVTYKCDLNNYIADIDTLLLKIHNVNFDKEIDPPFPFTPSQKDSLIDIYNSYFGFFSNFKNNQRKEYDNFFRLDGFAGTGKSTIIQNILNLIEFKSLKICSSSNTHAAVEVSRNIYHEKLKKDNEYEICFFEENEINIIYNLIKENIVNENILSFITKDNSYETLSSLLKEKPKYNSDGKIIFNENTINSVKKEDKKNKSLYSIQKYNIIIMDEYSMITEDKVEWFKTFSKYLKTFIIFVGDKGQIPPQINIQKESDLETKILNINMKNSCLTEIHRTKGDITILANLIRESKNLKEIKDHIHKFQFSKEIKIISGPLNINNFEYIQNSFISQQNYPSKLLAYSNNRIHQINEKFHTKINMNRGDILEINNKIITYKPIKIYGDDNNNKKYPIYLSINTLLTIVEKTKNINMETIIKNTHIKWDCILDNIFKKIDELIEEKIEDLSIKIKNKEIIEMIITENIDIKEITELEELRCNDKNGFKNILLLDREIKDLKNMKNYLVNNVSNKGDNYLYFKYDKILNNKLNEIKISYEKFLEKCKKNNYKCLELKVDGGKNVELKLQTNDIRNIYKKENNVDINESIQHYPFDIYLVTDKKEIANLCHFKNKIRKIMNEISEYINSKYGDLIKKTILLLQEIIWGNIHNTFDNLLIFSNNDIQLKKYFNISEDVYISYPYASTIHKSQGQTFYDVYIDVSNILNTNQHFIIKKKLLYTAITRCSNKLYLNLGY